MSTAQMSWMNEENVGGCHLHCNILVVLQLHRCISFRVLYHLLSW